MLGQLKVELPIKKPETPQNLDEVLDGLKPALELVKEIKALKPADKESAAFNDKIAEFETMALLIQKEELSKQELVKVYDELAGAMADEVRRLNSNFAPKYQKVLGILYDYAPYKKQLALGFSGFTDHLRRSCSDVPELQAFADKFDKANSPEALNYERDVLSLVIDFKETLESRISDSTAYKTIEERNAAREGIENLMRLFNKTTDKLKEVSQVAGNFDK